MASIRLQNIRKSYDGRSHVVHDLNLTIHDGELTVLVGPSGCGKSTTLRMLAGLEEVTSGEIYIGDRLVNHVPPGERDIAMVFQNYALYPHMTVRQNLAFGLKMRRMPKSEIASRVGQASEALELSELLDRRPRQLSGGQRQRVALGRAIVRDPQVFLFDEPLSNLDAKLRVQMRTEIAALHHRLGTTMVYVTHDQVEAMTLGERIVVMKDGVVQQVDAPLELYNRPANLFVAGFIGSPAMNFIPGQIRSGRFIHDAGELPIDNQLPDVAAVLGVRPEDLSVAGEGTPLARVRVEVVEHLGHESMVYFTLAGERQVARLEASIAFRIGDELDLAVKPHQWHLFANDELGRRL